jgi:hypothetical protein
MMRTTDIVKPYRVQLTHDESDRLIGISITAVDGNELDDDTIREATRSLLAHFKRQQFRETKDQRFRDVRARNQRVRDLQTAFLEPLTAAYARGKGKMTDEYLARLAAAYEELAATGASVLVSLSVELGKPVPTIRTHIKRAEDKGYLTKTTQGSKEGRQATPLARELLET